MPHQRLLPVLAILLFLGGCTTAQKGAIMGAHTAIAQERYTDALAALSDADKYAPQDPELKAKTAFLRATSYEGLQRLPDARGVYRYIIATFPESPEAAQAKERLQYLASPRPDTAPKTSTTPRPAPTAPNVRLGKDEFPAVIPTTSATVAGKPPKPLRIVNPAYPKELGAKGVAGVVMLRFVVGTDGRVHHVAIISSPDPRLSAAASDAIHAWRFQPGEKDGRKVECTLEVPITFEAQER